MAVRHLGNIQPSLDLEEHEGLLSAKRVYPISGAGLTSLPTVFAVVNTIGLVTNVQAGLTTLAPSSNYIGLTTTTLGVGDRFVGLVTAVTRNAGTNKTLKILPVTLSTNSNTSIAISNTFYITHLLLNSNATVRLNIKSGVTYLTGNASLGINIFPGGGWVENGAPDSPLYIGQAAAAAIVVEKFDGGGTVSQVSGKLVFFDE